MCFASGGEEPCLVSIICPDKNRLMESMRERKRERENEMEISFRLITFMSVMNTSRHPAASPDDFFRGVAAEVKLKAPSIKRSIV